jgi:hypothetical protein
VAIAFVRDHGPASNKTASTTITINTAAAVPAGNLLVVAMCYNVATTASVADSKGNTYGSFGGITATGVGVRLFGSKIGTALASGDTITVTFGVSVTPKVIALYEFSGCEITADGAPVTNTATSTALSSTSQTARTINDDLILQVFGWIGPNTDTLSAETGGFNVQATDGTTSGGANVGMSFCYAIRTATQTETRTATISTSRLYGSVLRAAQGTVTGTVYTETGTITLLLTPDETEVFEGIDSDTAVLTLVPDDVELAEAVESGTTYLDLQASGTDQYGAATAYTDAGTGFLDLVSSGTETREIADAAAAPILFTISVVEGAGFADATTTTLQFAPAASEQAQLSDAASNYLDLLPSGAELALWIDAATTTLLLTGQGDEYQARTYTDVATVAIQLAPSASDVAIGQDAGTAGVSFGVSGTELRTITDANTGMVAFTPAASDISTLVDAATPSVLFTVSGSELLAGQGTDLGTLGLQFTASAIEAITKVYVDAATVGLRFDVSAVEEVSGAFVDSATMGLRFEVSATEFVTHEYADVGQARLAFTASGTEQQLQEDTQTAIVTLSPVGVELWTAADTATTRVYLSPSGTDAYAELQVVYLRLTPAGVTAVGVSPEFIARLSRNYKTVLVQRNWEPRVLTSNWRAHALQRQYNLIGGDVQWNDSP